MLLRLLMLGLSLLPIIALIAAPYVEAAQQQVHPWDEVSEANLKETVTRLVGFGTRMSTSTKGIAGAREWLKQEFEKVAKTSKSPMKVDFHEFTDKRLARDGELVPQKNVYAMLTGKKHPKQVVVFGAHYDSVNLRDRGDVDVAAPGANDNATGTASVLEAARILSRVEHDRTICFVAFSSEEQGLIGARHFAQWLKESGLEVVAMLNNDIVGGAKDDEGKPLNANALRCFSVESDRHLARLAKLVVERRLRDFKILVQDAADRPGRGGDHQAFSRAGLTAIRFIEEVETDKVHHTANDTIDRIHFPFHVRATQADVALLENLAGAPPAPERPELDGTTVRWKAVEGAASYLVGIRQGSDVALSKVVEAAGTSAALPDGVDRESAEISVAAVDARGRVSLFSAPIAK